MHNHTQHYFAPGVIEAGRTRRERARLALRWARRAALLLLGVAAVAFVAGLASGRVLS